MKKILWTSVFLSLALGYSSVTFAEDGTIQTLTRPSLQTMPPVMMRDRIQSNSDEKTQDNQSARLNKAQQAIMKRMTKQITTTIKNLTKAQTKLQKSGLAMSSDCQTAVSDANTLITTLANASTTDESIQSDISDTMQNIGECIVQSKQLQKIPSVYKSLTRAVTRYKKNNPDENIDSDWNTVVTDYTTIQSGNFTSDDMQTFFDDARDMADTIGLDTGRLSIPQSPNNGEGNDHGGILNQGAAAIQSVGSYFTNLFK